MFKKMFGGKDEKKKEKEEKKMQRAKTLDDSQLSRRSSEPKKEAKKEAKKEKNGSASGGAEKKSKPKPAASGGDTKKRKKKAKKVVDVSGVDTSSPIEYPCTPEMIIAYHQKKPFLTTNEEWLLVELNEYECLVDGEDILKLIAKHSKFFEIDPPELWEEFFEYVEEMPAYDEVINNDVWQDFRDDRYPC